MPWRTPLTDSTPIWRAIAADIWQALDGPSGALARLQLTGSDALPSCFPVTDLAVASIGTACLAVSELTAQGNLAPEVSVDRRLASLWFGWSIAPIGWAMPSPWDAIAGDYQSQDGWIKLHTNAPHHRTAALAVLRCDATREAVASTVAAWAASDLEAAIVKAGGCAAAMRTASAWHHHPQGQAVASEPLIATQQIGSAPLWSWRPKPARPLAGLRVLDLTRVLAGPVATRFLAAYGADVLRVDPPEWDEPGVIPEVALGKRCIRLDLHAREDRLSFERLLAEADVLIHGYRGDALERLGYGQAARAAIQPALIDIALNAYGQTGPWCARRGFDSLVQMSCGIAAAGMAWRGTERPMPLPAQALDQATGYLLAGAAVRAVTARRDDGRILSARASLARTAQLLMAHQTEPGSYAFAPMTQADLADGIEATAWGAAQRVRPPGLVEGAPMGWRWPAAALGSGTARWES